MELTWIGRGAGLRHCACAPAGSQLQLVGSSTGHVAPATDRCAGS
jgi:hypothetical protein